MNINIGGVEQVQTASMQISDMFPADFPFVSEDLLKVRLISPCEASGGEQHRNLCRWQRHPLLLFSVGLDRAVSDPDMWRWKACRGTVELSVSRSYFSILTVSSWPE